MKQKQFVSRVVERIENDPNVVGLAVAGSFITNEMDEFSDVDLILVTKAHVSDDVRKMEAYAKSFGNYLHGFTGEHVGEKRVLICLYDNPLLHVDIKFLVVEEFRKRVENPVIVYDPQLTLEQIIQDTEAQWPPLDFQWIEDRFWTWVHYATLKLGRGENFETLDFLSFIRMMVLSPMLQVKNGKLPRGLRRVEQNFPPSDLSCLLSTVPTYEISSLFAALENSIQLYLELRQTLSPPDTVWREQVQEMTLAYLREIKALRLR